MQSNMDYAKATPKSSVSTDAQIIGGINEHSTTSQNADNTGYASIRFQCKPIEDVKMMQMRSDTIITRAMQWCVMVTTKSAGKLAYKDKEYDTDSTSICDDADRHLSVYVQCDPLYDTKSKYWHCYAKCRLTLVSRNPSKVISKEFRNNFTKKDNDFGYSEFIPFTKLTDPANEYIETAEDGNYLNITATIVTEYPYGVDWDSRSNTNHVGLLNLGATCYMNSLLQTFFFTNQLRLATYNTPTYMDDTDNSIMYALQHIFYQLQFSQGAVDTTRLTQAFGWTQSDSFQQHDVQEFCRILLESMENSMKGTAAEKIIAKLLEGKQMSFIKCLDVNYQSERVESVYDIQLKVKGLKNVYESFDDYIQIEKLDGENKYATEGYGYQDANKGVIFTHLPPVLHLHLMRFTFDMEMLDFIKIKDRYEFPEELNLDRYLHRDHIDNDDPAIYTLGAVLVHIGGINSGHYVVYIIPNCDGQWLKFDDDLVVKVNKNEAIEDNYGGSGLSVFKPGTTAYMLVYIRNSAKDHVFKGINCEDIPIDLIGRITRDISKEKSQQYKYEHQKEVIVIQLCVDECIYVKQSTNLMDQVDGYHFEFYQNYTIGQALNFMCSQLKIHPDHCRLWLFPEQSSSDSNEMSLGLPKFFSNQYYSTKLKDMTCYSKKITMFLDIVTFSITMPLQDMGTPVTSSEYLVETNETLDYAMIFIRSFNTLTSKLSYIGHVCVDVNQSWNYYMEAFIEKCELNNRNQNNANISSENNAHFNENIVNFNENNVNLYANNGTWEYMHRNSVTLFIEDSGDIPIKILDLDNSISNFVEKDQSCILCVQENFNTPPAVAITDFSQFIFQKKTNFDVTFIDKKYPVATERKFIVNCSPNFKYSDLIKIVHSHIVHPEEQIQLYYSCTKNIDMSNLPLLSESNPITVFDIVKKSKSFLSTNVHNDRACTIFYECLDINVNQLVHNVRFNLKFIPTSLALSSSSSSSDSSTSRDEKLTTPFHLPLLLPKNSTIKNLTQSANTYLRSIHYPFVNSVRILEVVSSKIVCVLTDDIAVSRILPSIEQTLVVEEIPSNQLPSVLTTRDRIVNCCFSHTKNFRQLFGVPFLLKISQGMTYQNIYDQIKNKLDCYPSDFLNKCSLFIVRTQQVDDFPEPDNMVEEFPYDILFSRHYENGDSTDESNDSDSSRSFTSAVAIGVSVSKPDNSPSYSAVVANRHTNALRIAK